MSPGLSTAFQGADDCRLRTSALRSKGIILVQRWATSMSPAVSPRRGPVYSLYHQWVPISTNHCTNQWGCRGLDLIKADYNGADHAQISSFLLTQPLRSPRSVLAASAFLDLPCRPRPGQRPLQVAETVNKVCPQHGEVRAARRSCSSS